MLCSGLLIPTLWQLRTFSWTSIYILFLNYFHFTCLYSLVLFQAASIFHLLFFLPFIDFLKLWFFSLFIFLHLSHPFVILFSLRFISFSSLLASLFRFRLTLLTFSSSIIFYITASFFVILKLYLCIYSSVFREMCVYVYKTHLLTFIFFFLLFHLVPSLFYW